MTVTQTATLLAFVASFALAPCSALAARPTDSPLLTCQYENSSVCAGDFMSLCAAIEYSDLNDRTRNGLITKVTDADTKVSQSKYDDANLKLDNIDDTIHALDDAPKPKISADDFSKIHAGLEEARTCSVL